MLNDHFFMATGLEMEQLDFVFALLNLDQDSEYREMLKEFEAALNKMRDEAVLKGKA